MNSIDIDLEMFLEEIDEVMFGESHTEKCDVCNDSFSPDNIWECPSNGIKRCDDCQRYHEKDECADCRLAYQDF